MALKNVRRQVSREVTPSFRSEGPNSTHSSLAVTLEKNFCSIFSPLTQVYKHPMRSGSLQEYLKSHNVSWKPGISSGLISHSARIQYLLWIDCAQSPSGCMAFHCIQNACAKLSVTSLSPELRLHIGDPLTVTVSKIRHKVNNLNAWARKKQS